ncbi:MAG TPA: hypothetical protein PKE12_15940 [Kiritimatiellia bacterium]|nr:hypothetical protein [Kiritimatiellia bacterium]
MRRSRRAPLARMAVCAVLGADVVVADPTNPPSATTPEAPPAAHPVDRLHGRLSDYVVETVDRADRLLHDSVAGEDDRPSRLLYQFYGDRYIRSRSAAPSYVTITPEVTFSEDPKVKADVDFSARVRLRRLSDRLEFYADRFDDEEDVLDGILGRVSQRQRESSNEGGAGLRYRLPDYFSLRSSVSASMAFRPEPVPRIRLRSRIRGQFGVWRVELGETLFWESDDGFGEKTQLDIGRPLGSNTLIRASSAAVWSETSRGVNLGQSLTWSHRLSQRRTVSLRAGALGHTEPETMVDLYTARAIWRQRIYRDWLFLEFEPGVDFPEERDFKATPLVSLRVDVILGTVVPEK